MGLLITHRGEMIEYRVLSRGGPLAHRRGLGRMLALDGSDKSIELMGWLRPAIPPSRRHTARPSMSRFSSLGDSGRVVVIDEFRGHPSKMHRV